MRQADLQRLQQAIGRYAQEMAAAAEDAGELADWLDAARSQANDGPWPPMPDNAPVEERLIPRLAECLAKFRDGTTEEAFNELVTAMGEGAAEMWAAVREGDVGLGELPSPGGIS